MRPIGTPGNLLLKVHEFAAPQRADGSFVDYSTDLSVYRDGEQVARKTIRVNDPLLVEGYAFHQNTFGPAAELTIEDATGSLVWAGPLLLDDMLAGRPEGFMTIPGAEVGLVAVLSQGADGVPAARHAGRRSGRPVDGRERDPLPRDDPRGRDHGPGGDRRTTYPLGRHRRMERHGRAPRPGQPLIWVAFSLLIVGLVLTFYFPRRRAWARVEDGRIGLAFLADRYVDKDREFGQLRDEVVERTGGRTAGG